MKSQRCEKEFEVRCTDEVDQMKSEGECINEIDGVKAESGRSVM